MVQDLEKQGVAIVVHLLGLVSSVPPLYSFACCLDALTYSLTILRWSLMLAFMLPRVFIIPLSAL